MKITCNCGNRISTSVYENPNEGHIIPAQEWYNTLDAIDDAIENSGSTPKDKEKALMAIRSHMINISKSVWQCTECGSLLISNKSDSEIVFFSPSNNTTTMVLSEEN